MTLQNDVEDVAESHNHSVSLSEDMTAVPSKTAGIGVSVGSAYKGNETGENSVRACKEGERKWFYMRVSYSRGRKAQQILAAMGIESFFPHNIKKTYHDGRLTIEDYYPLPGNIFIHCTEEEAVAVSARAVHLDSYDSKRYIPYLDFAYDHTVADGSGRNPKIIIPEDTMQQFIQASSIRHHGAHYATQEELMIKSDALVRVTAGPFKDVIGKVVKLYGKTRVAVSLPGIISYVTASVPYKNLEIINEEDVAIEN